MPLRASAVILCDDIRKEASQKDILIGVYGGDIIVGHYPGVLRAALWIEYEADSAGSYPVELRVLTPSGNPPPSIGFDLEIVEPGPTVFAIGGLPLHFERDGEIVVQHRLPGRDWETIKAKRVLRGSALPST